jgi:regulator of cell morphogenesis and NO signaling
VQIIADGARRRRIAPPPPGAFPAFLQDKCKNVPAMIDPSATLGLLVAEQPARAELFERLRLDYCCGGGQTLAEACERRRLDPDTVSRMLEAVEAASLGRWHTDHHDWRRATIAELCEHIVTAYHDKLRVELPRIDELLGTVVRVHGADHRELQDLQRLFGTMRQELESHLETEERVLFEACRAAEAVGTPVDASLIAAHEEEHGATGDAFAALRELANDYDTAGALCRTHRTLLESLDRLERDLHQHIHEENNILFPRVRDLR